MKLLKIWLLFIILCIWLPPLLHGKTEPALRTAPIENMADPAQERVRILDDNTEALLWRLRLIESADEKIILTTFQWWDDQAGTDIMAALSHAADRGVKVQVLIDGFSGLWNLGRSGVFREFTQNPNIEVKLYNSPNLLKPWKMNYRMHDKYLIVDDTAYILGGRNVGNLFLGNYQEAANEDRDILVYEAGGRGASYNQLREYFTEIWNLPCCKRYYGYGKAVTELEDHYTALRQRYPQLDQEIDWIKETCETGSVTLLAGSPDAVGKAPQVWNDMLDCMKGAEEAEVITPYIICSKEMYQGLEDLTQSGTKVRVITNAPKNGANPFGCTDYLNQKGRILEKGISVCEYWGAQSLHTKTVIVDENVSIVGSCNADMRSVYLDTELMLVIESEEINRQLRSCSEQMKEKSLQVNPDGTRLAGTDYREGKLSFWRETGYKILRVVIIPFRHLL